MRRKRVIGEDDSCYHVISRINEKRFYLGIREKAVFRDMMWRVMEFSGVEILTYSIMSNHFHILVRIPPPSEICDEELLRRLKFIYRKNEFDVLRKELESYVLAKNEYMRNLFRARFLRRMFSLTEFVRTLKQRFSIWYNMNNERVGPLWDGRFKSVLVQSSNDAQGLHALCVMAAYIDLNAIRADLADSPEDYHWCGYADAANGHTAALAGLRYIFFRGRGLKHTISTIVQEYHKFLLVAGLGDADHFSTERVQQTLEHRQELSVGELLRCKVRFFSHGKVLGCRSFVNSITTTRSESFAAVRKNGAQKVCKLESGDLCAGGSLKGLAVSVSQ